MDFSSSDQPTLASSKRVAEAFSLENMDTGASDRVKVICLMQEKLKELEAKVSSLESKHPKPEEVVFKPVRQSSLSAGSREKQLTPTKQLTPNYLGLSSERRKQKQKYAADSVRVVTSRGFESDQSDDAQDHPSQDSARGAAAIFRVYARERFELRAGKSSSLEIFNRNLQDLLIKVFSHRSSYTLHADFMRITSPFEPMIYNWAQLESEVVQDSNNEEEKVSRSALGKILELIKEKSDDSMVNGYFAIRDSLIKSNSITYEYLWTLFQPNTIVYGRPFLDKDQLFMVDQPVDLDWQSNSSPIMHDSTSSKAPWGSLKCWMYDWDEGGYIRRSTILQIPPFSGSKLITDLPYYPFCYHEEPLKIKGNLRRRGISYRQYCKSQATIQKGKTREMRLTYDGMAVIHKSGHQVNEELKMMRPTWIASNPAATRSERVKSDVILDFESYHRYGPGLSYLGDITLGRQVPEKRGHCVTCARKEVCSDHKYRHFENATGDEAEDWEDLRYILLPPRVMGYILQDKYWAQLDLETIKEKKYDKDAFQTRLHLKASPDSMEGVDVKKLLIDLVTTHGEEKGRIRDLVENKGRGLVVLLYGSPGSGKTSTAQTIASAAGKPLLSISVGDVGTKASDVESKLNKVFDLATRWKAVLLIDEVDVFVQSRTTGHQGPTTERNAFVSVFLRVLEYYQGILILTTNQIALFDIAIQSRIHIAIQYTGLDKDQSTAIFSGFLTQYKNLRLVENYDQIIEYVKTDLYKKKFDGRQLRNIVTSAMGIANARQGNTKITLSDVQTIVDNLESFKSNLDYQMRRYEDLQAGDKQRYLA